jgi:hypothetical protein
VATIRTKTIITKSLALLALLAVLAGCEITAKTASPDPVTVGEQLTFTIDVAFEENESIAEVDDELPDSVRFVSASASPGCDFFAADNTVRCAVENPSFPAAGTATITIAVTPTECGTFTNTAFIPEEDPEGESVSFTVVGCEVPPAPDPGQQQPNQQQGAPAPITQEFEQESESGDIDQTFEVS